ncbi:hypothetical protein AHAS_Ahas15G0155900 [Arachis hypogaea]
MESKISDDVPIIGMEFESLDAVIEFYNTYTRRVGFDWRNRSSKKNADGVVCYVMLVCNQEDRAESKVDETRKTYPKGPTWCKARMIAFSDVGSSWIVRVVKLKHCHDLDCTNMRLLRRNKKLLNHARGPDSLSFQEKNVRNFIDLDRRSIEKGGDGKAMMDYFRPMKERDIRFYYDIDYNEECQIIRIFFPNPRSIASYQYFGDVVSFDTIYITNKYDMSFATFVGVNHREQSVLLGCGLLNFEEKASFVWLFNF